MLDALNEIRFLLEERTKQYNHVDFIETDPIQIPHKFGRKEDVEIAGFLTASIAWGQRITIIKNAEKLMRIMDNSPFDFIMDVEPASIREKLKEAKFVHRTFNADDCTFFLMSLQNIYQNHGGLEKVFTDGYIQSGSVEGSLIYFRKIFLSIIHDKRVAKHVSDVSKNSSAKRLNMFLRWMVRTDEQGVDFGLWQNIPISALLLPLDVHTSDVARALGILTRKQNDMKAVVEIMSVLRQFDLVDPVKYDFALFGIGAFGGKDLLEIKV
jgi:uncharacterized protein (TIGR02757 family)